MPPSTNWCIVCRRNVSRVLGAYNLPYCSRTQSMIGVMPINGAEALAHFLSGVRSASASSESAERSFNCARGIPTAAKIASAASILFCVMPALAPFPCR
uniref:Dimer_Tnp_hAT domain-containing protein n=1 Tax=Heterorhabditis bacteriophora TaxID=37862 RepID=A0A1I7WBX1_HETBA